MPRFCDFLKQKLADLEIIKDEMADLNREFEETGEVAKRKQFMIVTERFRQMYESAAEEYKERAEEMVKIFFSDSYSCRREYVLGKNQNRFSSFGISRSSACVGICGRRKIP